MNLPVYEVSELTALESAVLQEMIAASADNGHDFGIMEEVKVNDPTLASVGAKVEISRQALGAVVTQLIKKGLVTVEPTMYVNMTTTFRRDRRAPGGFREIRKGGHPVTQYVLADCFRN